MRGSTLVLAAMLFLGAITSVVARQAATKPAFTPPRGLTSMAIPVPENNPMTRGRIALGEQLFFDKRLSKTKQMNCETCHVPEKGLTDGVAKNTNATTGAPLPRHTPTLWNIGYHTEWYWDGRAKTLEDNAKGAWGGGNMGAGKENLDKKAAEIAAIPGYKKLFEDAFGKTEIKADQVAQALSEYMRTFICNDTAYDKFAAGDKSALTAQQQRGLDVFAGKGACITCHAPPYFSTAMGVDGGIYFNAGIGTQVAEDKVDIGRMKVTNDPKDWAAFKPPSLRNVTKSPPYFHDGSVAKLEDAVRVMVSGGIPNKNKTDQLSDRKLTDNQVADLIAFLGALECGGKLVEPKLP